MTKRIAATVLAFLALCSCQLAFSTVGSWTKVKGPPKPITSSAWVPLADGRIALFGGYLPGGQPTNETNLYDPATGSWTSGAPMPGPGLADVFAQLRDGTVLVEGGRDVNGVLSGAAWLYDPARNTWSQTGSVIDPRSGPSVALLTDGRLLIAGGSVLLAQPESTVNGEVDFTPIASAEIYDPATKRWSQAGHLSAARNGVTLVATGGGGAVAAGGCQGSAGWSPPVATAETYDPATNAWSKTTALPVAICGAVGTTLRDGRALIVDSYSFPGVERYFYTSTNDAFVYDPKTRQWTLSAGLASGGMDTLLLNDGRVLVPEVQQGAIQGRLFKEFVGGQVFDPSTNQWTYASTTAVTMPVAYMFTGQPPIAIALANGTAVVILQTDAVAYDPELPPPSSQLLDSAGLTFVLGAGLVVILLLMLLAYRRAVRTDPAKLA
ncbi:MAG TPA: kelch repeat-containing protein [Candidatus Dormibacteraeota bacterium]|nr:kelch repeat-containing protein [Candidatus Dormibacteraeota bacterium]